MKERNVRLVIIVLSVAVPLLIGYLIFNVKVESELSWVHMLPHLNGVLNSFTALSLVVGFIMIKRGKRDLHKMAMVISFILASLFFVSYLVYHANVPSQMFGDLDKNNILDAQELSLIGNLRIVYLILLLSHIFLAAILVPFVLFAFYFALSKQFEKHKKVVKYTWPIWLYVSVSGVIVYLLISVYY